MWPKRKPVIDEMEDVAQRLREERPEVDPLRLDRIKTTAMARAGRGRRAGFAGRRVVAGALTVGLLAAGTGGVLAAGGTTALLSTTGVNGAVAQYSGTTTTTSGTQNISPNNGHKQKAKKKAKKNRRASHQRHVVPHFTG